jgi:hypothetical protein
LIRARRETISFLLGAERVRIDFDETVDLLISRLPAHLASVSHQRAQVPLDTWPGVGARVVSQPAKPAQKAGWGQPLPKGSGRGISLQFAFGTYLAQVAEVEVAKCVCAGCRLIPAC